MKRLWKSRTDRMIDGVCGGLAEYASVDPTLVRVAMVLLVLFGGAGFFVYLAGMILIPTRPVEFLPGDVPAAPAKKEDRNGRVFGVILVAVGGFLLMHNLGFSFWRHWWGVSWDVAIPVVLIAIGVALLIGGKHMLAIPAGASPDAATPPPADASDAGSAAPRRLTRSATDKKLFGVCGGVGEALGVDPVILRLLVVLGAIASFGLVLLTYVVLAIVMPKEAARTTVTV
jgi:phage shock protein C